MQLTLTVNYDVYNIVIIVINYVCNNDYFNTYYYYNHKYLHEDVPIFTN